MVQAGFSCKGTSTYRSLVGAAPCTLSPPRVRSVVAALALGAASQRADRGYCPFFPPLQQEPCLLHLCQHKPLLAAAHAHQNFTLLTGMAGFPFNTSSSALLAPVRGSNIPLPCSLAPRSPPAATTAALGSACDSKQLKKMGGSISPNLISQRYFYSLFFFFSENNNHTDFF